MRKPFVNSFTIAAGLVLGAALGLTAHAGSLHVFGSPSSVTAHTLASTSASESPEASPSPEPSESPEASPSPETAPSPEAAPSQEPVESPEPDETGTEDGGGTTTTQPAPAHSDDGSGDHQSGGGDD